jgi:hypothetical protein
MSNQVNGSKIKVASIKHCPTKRPARAPGCYALPPPSFGHLPQIKDRFGGGRARGFEIFLLPSRIHARPPKVNANCWALNCDYAAVVLIKIAIWRSEYKNTLIDVLLDKENSDWYSLKNKSLLS